MFEIEETENFTQEDYEACLKLLPQLLPTAKLPTFEEFKKIIEPPITRFFVAREKSTKKIVGMLTLILYRIPIGLCARIEDLVVDENHRKKGIGTKLCRTAIDTAKNAGAMKLDLTSNPSRIGAHRLYESLGFTIYDTSVYRLVLK